MNNAKLTKMVKNKIVTAYKCSNGGQSIYLKICKGVYQTAVNTYTVLKRVNGQDVKAKFTSKVKAIKFYKSL